MKKTTTYFRIICIIFIFNILDAKAQVIFRDDFARTSLGSSWITSEFSKWSIVNGQAYNFYDGQGATLITSKKFTQKDYLIETIAFPLKNGYHRQYSILFGKPNPDQQYGYVLIYNPYYDQGLTLGRSEGNDYWPVILGQKAMVLDPAKPHTFKIEHSASGKIKVFVDSGNGYGSLPVFEVNDKTYSTLGHLGWKVDTETSAEAFSVDWLEVRALPSLLTKARTQSGAAYDVANLGTSVPFYIDRTYSITSLPSYLQQAAFIKTANENKKDTRTAFLSFYLGQKSNIYVLYDPRASTLPEWLQGWTKKSERVNTNDTGTSYLNVYTKEYPVGTIVLGGNLSSPAVGSLINYIVAAVPSGPSARLAKNITDNVLDDIAISEVIESNLISHRALSSYPNPAQSKSTIRYHLAEPTLVKLTMYDQLGRSLAVVVNEQQQAGMHEQEVDLKEMTAGMYMYKLETGGQHHTGKLFINR